MHNDAVSNNKLSLSKNITAIYTISLGHPSITSFCDINWYPPSQTCILSNSPQVLSTTGVRIRLCAPQGLSLYSISKGRLNPTLVPVCVHSARAPNGPEGAPPQPKMSIIYRACEQDFISQPNASYFKTQHLSHRRVCVAGVKLKAISAAPTASQGVMFRHGSWGKMPWSAVVTLPLSSKRGTLEKCNREQASKRTCPNVPLIREAGECEARGSRHSYHECNS